MSCALQTIIECLKMATTGDLPPNCRSGQAFVNDPNIHGTAEVRCGEVRAIATQSSPSTEP